jgi:hypothetical protein
MAFESYKQLRQYRNDLSLTEYWGTAPPSSTTDIGPYMLGDVVWNTAPATAPNALGWICTTPGSNGATAVFTEIGAGLNDTYSSAANTTSFTATAAQVSGGDALVVLNLTGTLAAGQNITLPTVASLLAVIQPAAQAYTLRIINSSGANFAWTVVTNTGWTLNGTMTIAQNTTRDFIVNVTSASAATATLQSIGTGTYS